MSFLVRIFGHRGLSQMVLTKPKQYSSDSVFQLTQPYEFSKSLLLSGATPDSSTPTTVGDLTTILRVEVPDGQSVRYEINPSGRSVVAGTQSPILSGHDQFEFYQGWTISMVDAASYP